MKREAPSGIARRIVGPARDPPLPGGGGASFPPHKNGCGYLVPREWRRRVESVSPSEG